MRSSIDLFDFLLPSIVHKGGVVIRSVEIIRVLLIEVVDIIWWQQKINKWLTD